MVGVNEGVTTAVGGSTSTTTLDRVTLWVVVAHLLIGVGHSVAHLGAGVALTAAQQVFVAVVIAAAPFYGIYLHYRRGGTIGAIVLTVAMAASLIFGLVFHFVADTPDNIGHVHSASVGGWAPAFHTSAYAVLAVEVLGTLLAAAVWRRRAATR